MIIPDYQKNRRQADDELRSSQFGEAEKLYRLALTDLEENEEAQTLRFHEEQAWQFDPGFWGKILQEEIEIYKGLMLVYLGQSRDDEAIPVCFKLLAIIDSFYGYEKTDWSDLNQPYPRHAVLEQLLLDVCANLSVIYARKGEAQEAERWKCAARESRAPAEKRRYRPSEGKWLQPSGNPLTPMETVIKLRYDVGDSLLYYTAYTHAISVTAPYWRQGEAVSKAELWALRKIEQDLQDELEDSNEALYLACIPCDKYRLFLYYSRNPQSTLRKIQTRAADLTSHSLSANAKADSDFSVYKRWGANYIQSEEEVPQPGHNPRKAPAGLAGGAAAATDLPFEPDAEEFKGEADGRTFAELWSLSRTIGGGWVGFYQLVWLTKSYVPANPRQLKSAVEYLLKYALDVIGTKESLELLAWTLPRLDKEAAVVVLDLLDQLPPDSAKLDSASLIAEAVAEIDVERALRLCERQEEARPAYWHIGERLAQTDPQAALAVLDKAIAHAYTYNDPVQALIGVAKIMRELDANRFVTLLSQIIPIISKPTPWLENNWNAAFALMELCLCGDCTEPSVADAFLKYFQLSKDLALDLQVRTFSTSHVSGPEPACRAHILMAQAVAKRMPAEAESLFDAAAELAKQMNRQEDPVLPLCRSVKILTEFNGQQANKVFDLALKMARDIPITYMTVEAPNVGAAFKAVSLAHVLTVCPKNRPDVFAQIYNECLETIEKVKLDNERLASKLVFAAELIKIDAARGTALYGSILEGNADLPLTKKIELQSTIVKAAVKFAPEFAHNLVHEMSVSGHSIDDLELRFKALNAMLLADPENKTLINNMSDEVCELAIKLGSKLPDGNSLIGSIGAANSEWPTRAAIRLISRTEDLGYRRQWINTLVEKIGKAPANSDPPIVDNKLSWIKWKSV